MAGEVSKDLTARMLLPKEIIEAHEAGIIHFHDSDYFAQRMHNCDLVNLDDMLQNGTVISGTLIERPHSFSTACNIATQIIAQVASCQYGGQSISPRASRAVRRRVAARRSAARSTQRSRRSAPSPTRRTSRTSSRSRLRDEIRRGVQTIQYQVVTLMTTNGQAPFVTVFMYLNEARDEHEKHDLAMIVEEMLRQRYQGVKNEAGVWITPAFPKLIYVLEEDNITEGSEYFYLTADGGKVHREAHGARLHLREEDEGVQALQGRGRGRRRLRTPAWAAAPSSRPTAPATAMTMWQRRRTTTRTSPSTTAASTRASSPSIYPMSRCPPSGDMDRFWQIFDERLELCHRALRARHDRLQAARSPTPRPSCGSTAPLRASTRARPSTSCSTAAIPRISLGYAGLYECVKYMTGHSHTDPEATPFALEVMQHMNDKCAEWKEAENIDYSLYGTPLESTTYKFAKALQKRFGIIKGITDKGYITNSYHVHVSEEIDAFTKLQLREPVPASVSGRRHQLRRGPEHAGQSQGRRQRDAVHLRQHHVRRAQHQERLLPGVRLTTARFRSSRRTASSIWECPNCGNRDQDKLNVARRTCGYIGTQFWNQGRTEEIRDRVLHL